MLGTTFYFGLTRNYIIAIGNLFNDIWIPRKNGDVKVPIQLGTRQHWEAYKQKEIEIKKNDKKTIRGVAPKSLFTFGNPQYDGTRKRNTMNMHSVSVSEGITTHTQLEAVPYNFEVELFAHFVDIEDSYKYMEQVLAYFTPAFNLRIKEIPDMNIIRDIPLTTSGFSQEDESEEGGMDKQNTRINQTFNFILQGYLYKPVIVQPIIRNDITSIEELTDQI